LLDGVDFVEFVEHDYFEDTEAVIELIDPTGGSEVIVVHGPTAVDVYFEGDEGDADDDDGNNRDEVETEIVSMDLTGYSSFGPVAVRLNENIPTFGGIEELVNNNPGRLDLDPFHAGDADSFFDVFFEIVLPDGTVLHNIDPNHMAGLITEKPPGPGDTYEGREQIELYDELGRPTGFLLGASRHTPRPGFVEHDHYEDATGQVALVGGPIGPVPVSFDLNGPAQQDVFFEGSEGTAFDDDFNGRDEVATELVSLNLSGDGIAVSLNPFRTSSGQIEELVNNNPGWLDLDPFAPGDADSFFDVFFQIDVGGGLVLHNEEPIRIESVMDHKPAATFHFLPVLPGEPIELFDAAGRPTGIFLTTPAPPVDDDRFEPNDSSPAAHDFGELTSPLTESGLICGTQDWYEFTMLDVGGPTDEVTITFSHSQGDLDMGLRDSGGALLEASASSTDNETVSLDGVPAGTYYVQVVPYMGAFNPNYSLTIDPPPAPPVDDDRFEPNDSSPAAHDFGELTSPLTESGLICGTQDWYEFTMLDAGGPTDEVTITFSHSQGDLDMGLRDSGGALLEASASSTDNETVSLDGVPAGTYYVQVVPYMGAFNPNYSLTIDPPPAPANVAARQIFYNNSAWDGNDPAANPSDDGAIAPDKTVLRAGGVVSFANYSSYWRGINGIMIDIDNPTDTPTDADVGIRVNDAANPDRWSAGPVPTVSVRPGDGVGGSDRVTLIWPDEAITNQWVEVTMLATANTGLSADDVFYFANTIGDCDGDGEVDSSDYGVLVGEFGLRGGIATLAADLNADGRMNLTDFAIMRGAIGNSVLTPTIPAAAPEAAPAAPTATPPAGVEPIASVAARVGPVIGQLLDDRDTNNDPSTAAASAVAIDLLLPSPSATGYISEPGLISVGSPTTTLQRAATSEYDLRPLSDDMAVDEVDDSLADILAESALALPL
jgi:hypothetical protein